VSSGRAAGTPRQGKADRYQGFSLQSVCWGYRERFERAIEELFEAGTIGPRCETVTDKFFEVMRWAEEPGFENLLKDFLGALNPRARWIAGVPDLFADVVDTGRMLAEVKPYYGNTFFETMGRGGFGERPEQVRELMTQIRRVNARSSRLAVALVRGYSWMLERLSTGSVGRYVDWALEIHARNVRAGLSFMEGRLSTSEEYARHIGQACRLGDARPELERLIKALAGRRVEVGDLGSLDSDLLLERGSRTVCFYAGLYLPATCRHAPSAAANLAWYKLAAVCAAGMLAADCFPVVHGHRECGSCEDLVGQDRAGIDLFAAIEYLRGLEYVREQWPGAAGMLERALVSIRQGETSGRAPVARLCEILLGRGEHGQLRAAAKRCGTPFETAALVRGHAGESLRRALPDLGLYEFAAIPFLSDFGYRGETSAAPPDSLVLDLREASRSEPAGEDEAEKGDEAENASQSGADDSTTGDPEDRKREGREVRSGYVYDEWSQPDGGYYRDHCIVNQSRPEPAGPPAPEPDLVATASRVRRSMELLKPDAPRREKYLAEGDSIDLARLVDFRVRRRLEPSPRVDFYERPRTRLRDVAVLVLLDVSGSTSAKTEGDSRIIDCEKAAAVVLSDALSALGDRFAVCGFSGNGRQNCQFPVYKDFEESWDRRARQRTLAARPTTGTRMGAALRHGGYLLSKVAARRRIILLVSDARPMDADYDPASRYAQYDVRAAVLENQRGGIATFCICTDPESRADLGLMFVRHRYAVLDRIEELPVRLAELYARITR